MKILISDDDDFKADCIEEVILVVYPKATKTLKPDINRDILFAYTQDKHQLIANGNIALDETYSMLRFKDIE